MYVLVFVYNIYGYKYSAALHAHGILYPYTCICGRIQWRNNNSALSARSVYCRSHHLRARIATLFDLRSRAQYDVRTKLILSADSSRTRCFSRRVNAPTRSHSIPAPLFPLRYVGEVFFRFWFFPHSVDNNNCAYRIASGPHEGGPGYRATNQIYYVRSPPNQLLCVQQSRAAHKTDDDDDDDDVDSHDLAVTFESSARALTHTHERIVIIIFHFHP